MKCESHESGQLIVPERQPDSLGTRIEQSGYLRFLPRFPSMRPEIVVNKAGDVISGFREHGFPGPNRQIKYLLTEFRAVVDDAMFSHVCLHADPRERKHSSPQ